MPLAEKSSAWRPEIAQIIRESTFEWAVNGVGGWVDDELAVLRPWGLDPADISVPVLVRYGMTDVFVPPAHGEWLAANVPGCIVKINDAAGRDPDPDFGARPRYGRAFRRSSAREQAQHRRDSEERAEKAPGVNCTRENQKKDHSDDPATTQTPAILRKKPVPSPSSSSRGVRVLFSSPAICAPVWRSTRLPSRCWMGSSEADDATTWGPRLVRRPVGTSGRVHR